MSHVAPKGSVQLENPDDLSRWQIPMQPIPERVEAAKRAGLKSGGVEFTDAATVLDLENAGDGLTDAVVRLPSGMLLVACLTEMPGVTSAMWDWWFSWHSFVTERYQLWHPEAHKMAALKHDRSAEPRIRDRWVGNTSYVDEYLGPEMVKLAITFVEPSSVGLDQARVDEIGLAVCARTALRRERLKAGHLIHLLEDTDDGCRMHSRFWLGDGDLERPIIRTLVNPIINRPSMRNRLVGDDSGFALLDHCAAEMNHLARILPELYAEFGPGE